MAPCSSAARSPALLAYRCRRICSAFGNYHGALEDAAIDKREVLLSARCSSAVASAFSALSRIAEIGLRISWASPAAIRPMAGQSLGNASAAKFLRAYPRVNETNRKRNVFGEAF